MSQVQAVVTPAGKVRSVLLGVAIGDALGVPVEFTDHIQIKKTPVTDMIGYGTYHLSPGTFSDDSSLTFCLAEALAKYHNIDQILQETGQNCIRWVDTAYWTATGSVFDIGGTTSLAIEHLKKGIPPELAGGADAHDNGNGSLMRIAPLAFYLLDKPIQDRFEITRKISSITHRHIRSVIACFYYLEFLKKMYEGEEKSAIYNQLQIEIPQFLHSINIDDNEIRPFYRLLSQNISPLPETEMKSGGYVIETLEASIWCLLTTDTYHDAVLKAVNMGHDTDTTAAVTGGLAGLLYGEQNILAAWKQRLARYDDITNLSDRVAARIFTDVS